VRLVFIATGLLHDPVSGLGPEKQMRDLDPERLARLFAVNTIGPALAIKHFAPLLPRTGKSVIAAVSAKVGSIEDNRLGGWYGYRASKAALNQIVKTAAIEIAVRRKEAIVLSMHPGTVDTALSKPFQTNVAEHKLFSPEFAAERMLDALDTASPADSGALLSWDGTRLPF
jgi:NAD(P)-dependent dehydrogenase (short-subunit alcohol dehydrogenase family)